MTVGAPNLQTTMTNAEYAALVQNLHLLQDRTAQAAAASRTQDVVKQAVDQVPETEAAEGPRIREQDQQKPGNPRQQQKPPARPPLPPEEPPAEPEVRPAEKGKGSIVDLDA